MAVCPRSRTRHASRPTSTGSNPGANFLASSTRGNPGSRPPRPRRPAWAGTRTTCPGSPARRAGRRGPAPPRGTPTRVGASVTDQRRGKHRGFGRQAVRLRRHARRTSPVGRGAQGLDCGRARALDLGPYLVARRRALGGRERVAEDDNLKRGRRRPRVVESNAHDEAAAVEVSAGGGESSGASSSRVRRGRSRGRDGTSKARTKPWSSRVVDRGAGWTVAAASRAAAAAAASASASPAPSCIALRFLRRPAVPRGAAARASRCARAEPRRRRALRGQRSRRTRRAREPPPAETAIVRVVRRAAGKRARARHLLRTRWRSRASVVPRHVPSARRPDCDRRRDDQGRRDRRC